MPHQDDHLLVIPLPDGLGDFHRVIDIALDMDAVGDRLRIGLAIGFAGARAFL